MADGTSIVNAVSGDLVATIKESCTTISAVKEILRSQLGTPQYQPIRLLLDDQAVDEALSLKDLGTPESLSFLFHLTEEQPSSERLEEEYREILEEAKFGQDSSRITSQKLRSNLEERLFLIPGTLTSRRDELSKLTSEYLIECHAMTPEMREFTRLRNRNRAPSRSRSRSKR
mmetsp:Transcript_77819/g.137230  ORF Transcript_77819/g.137230 Transcript_77819/m.137230 type:complete len:173 (-) Transcript_77819:48-566(-)